MAKLAALFKEGRNDFEDYPRSGRPIAVHSPSNIELVRQIIKADPHSTFDDIVAQSSINRFTVSEINHNSLKLRKLASRCIQHELTDKIEMRELSLY